MTNNTLYLENRNKYKSSGTRSLTDFDNHYHSNTVNTVNIKKMKDLYIKKYPGSNLSKVLMNEPDEMTAIEFIAKVGTWLKI